MNLWNQKSFVCIKYFGLAKAAVIFLVLAIVWFVSMILILMQNALVIIPSMFRSVLLKKSVLLVLVFHKICI